MSGAAEPARYGAVAQALHWLVALLVVAAFCIGFYMVDLTLSPTRLKLFSYHKWIGVTVFALALLRIAWRVYRPPPPLPASVPAWQQRASAISHRVLMLLILAVPLSGWLMSSAKGFQTVYFGVLPIPDLLGKNPDLGQQLESLHWALNKLLLGVVTVHVAAALKHHYVDRDGVLLRMLPRLPSRKSP
ncbi:cytochrome b [Sinimarinibacterium thermocellulolyticum]|uniref:Cytochrome b n=1 Tax=Sinimarinibacterium thermocellulolyticum TaxID=3170016 RepID=A0ABV2ADB2_9GAMM